MMLLMMVMISVDGDVGYDVDVYVEVVGDSDVGDVGYDVDIDNDKDDVVDGKVDIDVDVDNDGEDEVGDDDKVDVVDDVGV